jgi:hypothetical protein
VIVALRLLSDPPLGPTGDEGRSLVRRELLRPEYNDQALLTRFVDWLRDQVSRGLDAAAGSPPLATLAAMVVLVLLVSALGWLFSRARLTSRSRAERTPALADDGLSADALRARAEAATVEGRHEDAVVDGFRALALRQIERGRIEGVPGATAHELAVALGAAIPPAATRTAGAADLFDLVRYGGRPATADQARGLLDLDDALLGVR